MKILLITRYFPPLEGVASLRLYCWAKYMTRLGHEITVLTTDKTGQPQSLKYDTTPFKLISLPYFDPINFLVDEEKKGEVSNRSWKDPLIRFYRCRMNERMPNRTDLWIFAARKWVYQQNKGSFDAVISSYGPPSSHVVALAAKKHFDCPWVADYRDLWIENHCPGIWPFTHLERWIEKRLSCHADAITTVSKVLKNVFEEKYPSVSTHVIHNGYDPDLFNGVQEDAFKGHPKKFRLVYTGTLYEGRHDISPLLDAVKELDQSYFELHFYGEAAASFLDQINARELNGIVFHHGKVPHQKALSLQQSASALLLLHFQYHLSQGVMTGKVFEYLYSPPPILGIGIQPESELGLLLKQSGKGLIAKNDPSEIQKAIFSMIIGRSSKRNEAFIRQFSREEQAKKVIEIIQAAC